MTTSRRPTPSRSGILPLALAGLIGVACADHADGRWAGWTTLRLDATAGPLFDGQVEIRLDESAGERRMRTRSSATLLGLEVARAWTETVLDAGTGRPRSCVAYSPKRGRRYRFGDAAYSVEKLRPPEGPEVPPERWEVTSREEFANPEGGASDGWLHDSYGMLLGLRALGLNEPGDAAAVHVATSGGPELFRVSVEERRTRRRSYTDLASGEPTSSDVHELRLRIVPAGAEADEGLLGMEGETEVWVEAATKTPIEISGQVPQVGRVTLSLAALG